MLKFKEVIELCRRTGFIIGTKAEDICLGPLGSLLSENLRNEWLYNNVNCRDINILLNTEDSLSDTYNYAKELCGERIPFGIAQIFETKSDYKLENEEEVINYFNPKKQVVLKTHMFVSPSTSDHSFYNWQNQRRIWWRKISASPGRYSLTEIQIDSSEKQSVEIVAKYPWGSQIMESVILNPAGYPELTNDQLQVKDGRKKVLAHCVSSTTYLFSMTLNTLCDAYDDAPYKKVNRPMLRFHRKIAPYKISFCIPKSSSTDELNELALYLCLKLRKDKFSVLYNPNCHRNTLDSQWDQCDQMGIPYTIVLNEATLKTGILHLRSRDTTLQEEVHITNIPEYVDQLLKNY